MSGILPVALLIYAAASLFHHVHNAVFVDAYPNMPASLTSSHVYAAWLAVTAVGILGYLLHRRGHRLAGLCVMALYAAFGLYGLLHYHVAPMAAHTAMMHLSILAEVAGGLLLLGTVVTMMLRR